MNELKYYFTALKKRPLLTALAFSLCLTAIESFAFNQNYVGYFETFSFESAVNAQALFFVCFAFTGLLFFVHSMLRSTLRWQCTYFGVFALALSVEYGFYGALGRFTLPSDLENAFYASDASDKFGAITLFFNWFVIIPLTIFRLLFYFSPSNARGGAKLFFINLVFLLAGFAVAADFYRQNLPTNAFAAHFNNLASSALYFGETKTRANERLMVTPIVNATPRNNVVFIVDESVRADHLSLNGYLRQTTPTLKKLERENLWKNWGTGVSGSTESVGSNRMLLTGLANLPDRERQICRLPTVFQYARAAGYRTFYFDGQSYSDWIGDETDQREFGRIYTARDFPAVAPFDLDRAFAAKIREIVASSSGNFIWINKRGAHFRYEKNYPPEKVVWTPVDSESEKREAETLQPLINNYDNAIFYNSESFFQTLVGDYLPAETVFVYTSDHGQTLTPNRASHAGDSKTEAAVPIFVIGSDKRLQSADKDFAAAHRNIFATLLDLMDYPKDLRAYHYAPSLFEVKSADSEPRTYFVGNPSGAFGGKKMFFDETEK
jgi:glucan phosphoethanolaminetransferase (alkaline phosphatase superfamily)